MISNQESRILNFKADSHKANNDPQTREQKAINEVKVLKVQADRNLNRLINLKMMIQDAK